MTEHRPKLHPSTCFPPDRFPPDTRNRLLLRIAPTKARCFRSRVTFIGINPSTYSAVAALLACRTSASIECIKLFNVYEKEEIRATLHDLQLISLFTRSNTRLEWAQSYWETKHSTIIIINVQHNQLENESTAAWTQMNASLIETIVSQVCIHSPHATLIICTQPNELMTYVASRVSGFPCGRVIGLGASVDTAYAHRVILDQSKKIHGRVNGIFTVGTESVDDACASVFSHNLTIDGIRCLDMHSKLATIIVENKATSTGSVSKKTKSKGWDLVKILEKKEIIHSNVRRRLPIVTDLISRQKIVTKYLQSHSVLPQSEAPIKIPIKSKVHSNWTEAMLIVRITRALINGGEYQSNFAVNIAPITGSNDIFINYSTILGASNRGVEYLLPFHLAKSMLSQRLSLIPYEKLQSRIRLLKAKV